ncbi:MAG: hypothetical protein ACLP1X_34980 [Polyangiaceae bacterium]
MDRSPFALVVAILGACHAESPPRGPEDTCAKACVTRAGQCSAHECARGCNLVLDRLVEHEGGHVLACVARGQASGTPCDDKAWARCAALVGPHADGGPPAPPSAGADDSEDGD